MVISHMHMRIRTQGNCTCKALKTESMFETKVGVYGYVSVRIGRLDIYVYKQWIEIVGEKNSFQALAMYLYIV